MALNRQDKVTLFLFAIGLIATALSTAQSGVFHSQATFGTEYGNLAENLALGNGFAGTFEVSTQPSAWMPPLLSLMMAAVFLVFGIKTTASAQALLVVQILFLCLSLSLLLLVATRQCHRRWPLAILFGFFILGNRKVLFLNFHDVGWTVFLSCLALYSLTVLSEGKLAWPMLSAAVLPLGSPALALAYAFLTPFSGASRKSMVMVFACFTLSVSGWTARNAVAMGAFVPLKSNLWFDFHQANVLDPDGIVSAAAFFRFHPAPGVDPKLRSDYRAGEIPFMAAHRQQALQYVQSHPGVYFQKLLNRLANATLLLKTGEDVEASAFILDAETQAYLAKRHLVAGSRGGVVWCCLDLDETLLQEQLSDLESPERERLSSDWRRAREALAARDIEWRPMLWGLSHSLVPFLAILLGALRPTVRGQQGFRFAVGLYVVYLVPYVLVSHYARYQVSLIGLAAYLIWQAAPSGLSAFKIPWVKPDPVDRH
jgi:hypothetical protein